MLPESDHYTPTKVPKPRTGGWSVSRRNLVAASAILAAAVTTRSNKALAMSRPPRGGGGKGGGGGGKGGGGKGGGSHRCFLAGTHILTPSGEVEVGTLRVGDLVTTQSGDAKPIVRIETTSFDLETGMAWDGSVLPVRIQRGAIDTAVPHRDLFLSRGHPILLDGVLIPIAALVNGSTIGYADRADLSRLEYIHIELEQHDILIAEGAPCESLLERDSALTSPASFAPVVSMGGGRAMLKSRLRSALSPIIDRRTPLDLVRDRLEERAEQVRAA